MTPYLARSFTASFGLHAALLGLAALLYTLGPRLAVEPSPPILTILPAPAAPTGPTAPEATPYKVVLPLLPPASAPEPVAPPKTQPAPVAPPAPPRSRATQPAPPKTPAPTAATAPRPAPATSAPGKKMTHDEFIRQHGAPAVTPSASTSATKLRPAAPQLSSAAIIAEVTAALGHAPSADPDITSALIAQLQAAFAATGPWPENLSAKVSFTLGADGKLRSITIASSSDHPAFDAAARTACRQAQVSAVPSSAAGQAYQITFSAVPRK